MFKWLENILVPEVKNSLTKEHLKIMEEIFNSNRKKIKINYVIYNVGSDFAYKKNAKSKIYKAHSITTFERWHGFNFREQEETFYKISDILIDETNFTKYNTIKKIQKTIDELNKESIERCKKYSKTAVAYLFNPYEDTEVNSKKVIDIKLDNGILSSVETE